MPLPKHRLRKSPRGVMFAVVAAMWLAGVAVLLWSLIGARAVAQDTSAGPAYRIIVNAGNPRASIDRSFVGQAFLKKVRSWPQGALIEPVDLDERSPIRRRCSEDVLGRSVAAVKSYWQQMIFSGRDLPPPEVESDDAVVTFVAGRPGAIGYVSASASLRGTKVLTLH